MKQYVVDAKISKDSIDNYIHFCKEDGNIWIGIGSMEEREFSIDEVKEIIRKLQECINEE